LLKFKKFNDDRQDEEARMRMPHASSLDLHGS